MLEKASKLKQWTLSKILLLNSHTKKSAFLFVLFLLIRTFASE